MHWLVDGNNVVGAGADGWWNDRPAAAARFTDTVARWCRSHADPVVLVFDGRPDPRLTGLAGGNLQVTFATRSGRDAADDRIVDLARDLVRDLAGHGTAGEVVVVVTSDRGLIARLPPGVATEGAGRFRARIGLPVGGRPTRRRDR